VAIRGRQRLDEVGCRRLVSITATVREVDRMLGVDYLGQSSVRAAVLPARAVYLINEGSVSGLRRAVQEACSRWAGMTEPIVPVRPDGGIDAWWVQVAQLSKADEAVNVDVANQQAATAAQQLDLQLLPLRDIDSRASITQFTCHTGAVGPPSVDQNAYIISSSEEAPLWEVIAAGDLTSAHLDDLNTETLWVRRAQEDDIARAQLWGNSLLARTVAQFGEHSAGGGPSAFPAIVWVTEPDSVQDCLFFWNLRALRPLRLGTVPMLLLPVDHVQHWIGFPAQLAHVLTRPDEFSPDVVIDSVSVRKAKLNSTARLLGLRRTTKEVRSGHVWPTNLRQPHLRTEMTSTHGSGLHFSGSTALLPILMSICSRTLLISQWLLRLRSPEPVARLSVSRDHCLRRCLSVPRSRRA
jgi:hypothetical protein